MIETERYDVVIYEKVTRKIDAIIGRDMRSWDGETGTGRNTAEMRMQTGLERVNELFGVSMVPAGKYQKGDVLREKLRRTGRRDPLKVLTAAQMLKAYHD